VSSRRQSVSGGHREDDGALELSRGAGGGGGSATPSRCDGRGGTAGGRRRRRVDDGGGTAAGVRRVPDDETCDGRVVVGRPRQTGAQTTAARRRPLRRLVQPLRRRPHHRPHENAARRMDLRGTFSAAAVLTRLSARVIIINCDGRCRRSVEA